MSTGSFSCEQSLTYSPRPKILNTSCMAETVEQRRIDRPKKTQLLSFSRPERNVNSIVRELISAFRCSAKCGRENMMEADTRARGLIS